MGESETTFCGSGSGLVRNVADMDPAGSEPFDYITNNLAGIDFTPHFLFLQNKILF